VNEQSAPSVMAGPRERPASASLKRRTLFSIIASVLAARQKEGLITPTPSAPNVLPFVRRESTHTRASLATYPKVTGNSLLVSSGYTVPLSKQVGSAGVTRIRESGSLHETTEAMILEELHGCTPPKNSLPSI